MESLVCSIYYPHSRLDLIVREAVFPFTESIKKDHGFCLSNFRLSAYKGENIVLWFECNDPAGRQKLRDELFSGLKKFITAHPAGVIPEVYPLKKLFRVIPPNTIHFWDKNPFKTPALSGSDPETDRQIQSLISGQCLYHLYNPGSDVSLDLHKLYIQLLIILTLVCKGSTTSIPDFSNRVLLKVKSLKKNSWEAIGLLEDRFRKSYFSNRQQIDQEVSAMIRLSRFPVNSDDNFRAFGWIKLFEEIENIRASKNSAAQFQSCPEILIEISQRFSLIADELIKAMVFLQTYFNDR